MGMLSLKPPLDIEDFERVEEDYLRNRYANTKAPSLAHMLKIADEWREAGCTPVFLVVNEEPTIIACFSLETFGKYTN